MMRKLFRLEHHIHATAKAIIRWGLLIATLLIGAGLMLSFLPPDHALYALHLKFADVGVFVFAESVIAGLLFDVIYKRQS